MVDIGVVGVVMFTESTVVELIILHCVALHINIHRYRERRYIRNANKLKKNISVTHFSGIKLSLDLDLKLYMS